MKAKVFPDPVLAAPRISRPQSAWGKEALCISVILTNLASRNPSLVFLEIGNWSNLVTPAQREYVLSSMRPTGSLECKGGNDMGLEPESGFWDWIHESKSLISSSSRSRCRLRKSFDLGFLIAGNLRKRAKVWEADSGSHRPKHRSRNKRLLGNKKGAINLRKNNEYYYFHLNAIKYPDSARTQR